MGTNTKNSSRSLFFIFSDELVKLGWYLLVVILGISLQVTILLVYNSMHLLAGYNTFSYNTRHLLAGHNTFSLQF